MDQQIQLAEHAKANAEGTTVQCVTVQCVTVPTSAREGERGRHHGTMCVCVCVCVLGPFGASRLRARETIDYAQNRAVRGEPT